MYDDIAKLRAFRPQASEPTSAFGEIEAVLDALPEGPRAQLLAAFQRINESRSATEAQAKYFQGRMAWAREALLRLYQAAKDLEEPCDCEACPQCTLTKALDAADDALNHLPQR
ncbi:MAG TPA: hypothetical protein V6D05_11575 [Stenomitos sp.]